MRASCFVTRLGWTSKAFRKSCMSVPARATCWIHGSGSNDRKNLKPFEGSAPRSSPRVWRPRWNWRVRSAHPCPARRSPKGSSNAYWRLIERHTTARDDFAHKGNPIDQGTDYPVGFSTGRPSVEKLARELGRRLARLEDFFFRLILEFCVLLQGKIIFSRNDADLF